MGGPWHRFGTIEELQSQVQRLSDAKMAMDEDDIHLRRTVMELQLAMDKIRGVIYSDKGYREIVEDLKMLMGDL